MTLKVNQILHHEKSQYQDVLIFESSDHGTVLVLDNVIQCTERDEFSFVSTLSCSLILPFQIPLLTSHLAPQLPGNDHPPCP